MTCRMKMEKEYYVRAKQTDGEGMKFPLICNDCGTSLDLLPTDRRV